MANTSWVDGAHSTLLVNPSGAAAYDANGNVGVTLSTQIAGEDQVNNRMMTAEEFSFAYIPAATQYSGNVKSGAGVFKGLQVNKKGGTASQLVVYNNTTPTGAVLSGNIIATIDMANAPIGPLPYGVPFTVGLSLYATGAAGSGPDITVLYL